MGMLNATFRKSLTVFSIGLGVAALPALATNPKADAIGPVEVSSAVYSDVSIPVRDLWG